MVRLFVKHPLILIPFLCFAFSLCSAGMVQIDDICSKHNNPYNCDKILSSIPGLGAGVDVGSLSLYIINLGHVNAFDIVSLIDDIIRNNTDPQLRQRYNSCTMDYSDVLSCFTQAKEDYNGGNYNDIKTNGATVIKNVQDCDTKAYDSPELRLRNQDLIDVSGIIMILADFLAGKF